MTHFDIGQTLESGNGLTVTVRGIVMDHGVEKVELETQSGKFWRAEKSQVESRFE